MNIFEKHEIFEIEVLTYLKNNNLLSPLVFAGGTMLRLCYDSDRYSTDLDFWFIHPVDYKLYFDGLKTKLSDKYELTDAQLKFNTLLFEIRSSFYPKRLKIEIRKQIKQCDYQKKIAFSKYTNAQVLLNALTLKEAMKAKVEAALNRKNIRDFYDIEFLLRKGVALNVFDTGALKKLKSIALNFKNKDFKVILGAVLEQEIREYYIINRFEYLVGEINGELNKRVA